MSESHAAGIAFILLLACLGMLAWSLRGDLAEYAEF
jgi:hypothetical protein